jgi:hypothetical protein
MIQSVHCSGPQGAAVPLTREQELERAVARIRSEVNWARGRRDKARTATLHRIATILDGLT